MWMFMKPETNIFSNKKSAKRVRYCWEKRTEYLVEKREGKQTIRKHLWNYLTDRIKVGKKRLYNW